MSVRSKWGVVPRCRVGCNHRWNDEESGVCSKCRYDAFDKCYRVESEM